MSSGQERMASIAAEEHVLGSLLTDVPFQTLEITEADFCRAEHRLIYAAMAELACESVPVTCETVAERLESRGHLEAAGGAAALLKLHAETATSANAAGYAKLLRDCAARRRIQALLEDSASGPELAAALERELGRLKPLSNREPLRLYSLEDYVTRPRVTWLYRDFLAAESIAVVFGAAKSGKTHVIVDVMMHAAHGMHWHGYLLTKALRVVYLAGEGHAGLRTRLHAWRRHHATELKGDIRILPQALSLAGRLEDLIAELQPFQPDVIVADTLNAYFGAADENSSQDMTAFVGAVRRLRDELHSAVVVIHHTGLQDSSRERGSSVLRGAADVIAQVARDESGSGLIGLQVIEARDQEPWAEALPLRLVAADTDWADDDGQPIRTCLVERAEQPVTLPGRGGKPLGAAQAVVLELARQMARERANGSGEVILARQDVAALAKARGLSKQSISSAWQSLQNRGLLRLIEPGSVTLKVT